MTAGQVQWRIDTSVRWGESAAPMMQHPLDMGAHYYPPGVHPDHRTHRYRSFMIEEILTDHPDQKVSAPAGELLKFGVHALLSARPLHSQLGKKRRELTSCSHFFNYIFGGGEIRFILKWKRIFAHLSKTSWLRRPLVDLRRETKRSKFQGEAKCRADWIGKYAKYIMECSDSCI